MKNFIQELNQRIRAIDNQPIPHSFFVNRFNIHRRTLPIKSDDIVVFNVSQDEANWWVERKLLTTALNDRVVYYDIVQVNASDDEKSVLHNKRPFVKEL